MVLFKIEPENEVKYEWKEVKANTIKYPSKFLYNIMNYDIDNIGDKELQAIIKFQETYSFEKVKSVSLAAASLYEFFDTVIARKNIIIKNK